jgi:hypothetical protein
MSNSRKSRLLRSAAKPLQSAYHFLHQPVFPLLYSFLSGETRTKYKQQFFLLGVEIVDLG